MPICHGTARLMLRDHDGSGGSRSARPPLFGLPFAGALAVLAVFACVGSSSSSSSTSTSCPSSST